VLQLGLCDECFGPLYVTSYDPEGKALRRRVERRLLSQLVAGCGKEWCRNKEFCRTGRKNQMGEDRGMTAKDALPVVKPVVDGLNGGDGQLWFCVDEASQRRREIAQQMAEQGEYEVEWWVTALEETRRGGQEDLGGQVDKAREWLSSRAPKIGEVPT
jgi:hypothetical protein